MAGPTPKALRKVGQRKVKDDLWQSRAVSSERGIALGKPSQGAEVARGCAQSLGRPSVPACQEQPAWHPIPALPGTTRGPR